MSRVSHTVLAHQDLKDIGTYLESSSQSREVALRFLDRISAQCTMLAQHPLAGELRPDLASNVRQFTVGSYVVFYRERSNGIDVLRVLHGSRDIHAQWRSKG